jgi:energy-coupling factor transporter ATP-binding protein EcfA2
VAIARALVTDPTLIVADEPTGDLDRATGEEVLDLLDELHRELGKTIVMVTHDPKAAARAGRLIHLEKGVLVPTKWRPTRTELSARTMFLLRLLLKNAFRHKLRTGADDGGPGGGDLRLRPAAHHRRRLVRRRRRQRPARG